MQRKTEGAVSGLDRRQLLAGVGAVTAAATIGGEAEAATATSASVKWDHETDVLCVGSGAAACMAGIAAIDAGAKVMLVEKMPLLGGTTGKSGGVLWIPNNFFLKSQGKVDEKQDCLRYMARYAFPQQYNAASPTLGLADADYRLLVAFYDNGSVAVDKLRSLKAVDFEEFRMYHANIPAPDYADHLPENKMPTGRALQPAGGLGPTGGLGFAERMEQWLRKHGATILTETRVNRVIRDRGRVIGVAAETENGAIHIRARRGVVFGTGGFAHNTDLINHHQTALYGSCASTGATGDLIPIASEIGAKSGGLHMAWRTQVVLEEALQNRAMGLGAFFLPGDSMIAVNKYGKRVVNEKRDYNDRTRVHFTFDPTREEYPNQLMFMVFDARSLDAFGGSYPIPVDVRESPWLIQGNSLAELTTAIGQRLEKIGAQTGHVALSPDFATTLQTTINTFNGYAKAGKDPEFQRGEHDYDRSWQLVFSPRREGTKQPENPYPNNVMHPLSDKGPYYAFILAAGALDTNGGPVINEKAQIVDYAGKPVPGLYGAGNCIASPSREAYYGAGGTIGLALAFGYLAGINAAAETAV
ncbi:MAG: FAD-dependent oxidoreductase [Sphingomonadaceae bacterium]